MILKLISVLIYIVFLYKGGCKGFAAWSVRLMFCHVGNFILYVMSKINDDDDDDDDDQCRIKTLTALVHSEK